MEKVEFAGTVVNISRSGILMGLDFGGISRVLRLDAVVRVVVDLPRHPLFSPRCLECTATVVRIVVAKTQTEVAVEIGQVQVTDQSTKGPRCEIGSALTSRVSSSEARRSPGCGFWGGPMALTLELSTRQLTRVTVPWPLQSQ